MTGRRRVAIVGGGIVGLSTAYHLAGWIREGATDVECRLFDAGDAPGGVIRTERTQDFLLDLGPDSIFKGKPAAAQLAREIGLENELLNASRQKVSTLIYSAGRLHPLPEGLELVAPTKITPFLASRLFSLPGKLRMMMEPLVPARRNREDESIAQFIRRRFGEEALQKMAGPLLAGIHAGDPERLSMRSTFARLPDLEVEHGSIALAMQKLKRPRPAAAGPPFVTLRSGMIGLVDRLLDLLEPVRLEPGRTVEGVDRTESGYRVRFPDEEPWEVDACVVAVPAPAAAALLEPMSPPIAEALRKVRYVSTAAVFLGYRNGPGVSIPPSTGFLIPVAERRGIFGCTFASNKFQGRAPEGHILLRAFVGGALDEEAVEAFDDEQMVSSARQALAPILGLEAEPILVRVQRWSKANPQYEVGHGTLIEAVDRALSGHPGLAVTGSGLRGIGVSDGVVLGREAAEQVRSHLAP